MLPSRLLLPAAAAAVLAAAAPSPAAAPRTTTVTYGGPTYVQGGGASAQVFLTDSPGTLTGFVVSTGPRDSRLRIRVADATGRAVAVTVSWGEHEQTFCDATDVRTPAFEGGTELYVDVLAGLCGDGASVPTRGTITFDLQ